MYIELPQFYMKLSPIYKKSFIQKIKQIHCYDHENKCRVPLEELIISIKFVQKNKLYNYSNGNKYPFLKLYCRSGTVRKYIVNALKNKRVQYIDGYVNLIESDQNSLSQLKTHESNIDPILQMVCQCKISTTGWIGFVGVKVDKLEQETLADEEYIVSHGDIFKDNVLITIPQPTILSFDLEVFSSNQNAFPNYQMCNDEIFQISCILRSPFENKDILISRGYPDKSKVFDDGFIRSKEIIYCICEKEILEIFHSLIIKYNPQFITGYNIFSFDIKYMIKRAERINLESFFNMGCIIDKKCKTIEIKWASTAMKSQDILYFETEGRIWVDLLPVIQRDYKLNDYKLKTVSEYFIGDTKDDFSVSDIFTAFKLCKECPKDDQNAIDMISQCGKYCMKDSILCIDIFYKIDVFIYLSEMAKICNVNISTLFTKGQQIKVFSQVYKECYDSNYLIEQNPQLYDIDENIVYEGAYVFEPIPGAYDNVIPFDFTSLYPTIMIAYNICFSTYIPKINWELYKDEDCHVIEFESNNVKYKYKFIKNPIGILPILLKNLIKARSECKKQMKHELDSISKKILDKRQLAYKVSCNSVYGSLGTQKGYLPFMIGAMCTTALGRINLHKAKQFLENECNGKVIYGDTDSNYIQFNFESNNSKDMWDYCLKIQKKMEAVFPKPMMMLFEEAIYTRFFILSKKRYMALKMDRDGKIDSNILSRGVILSRRDHSMVVKQMYQKISNLILYNRECDKSNTLNTIKNEITDHLQLMFTRQFDIDMYKITKQIDDESKYKFKIPPNDLKKKINRFKKVFEENFIDYQQKLELCTCKLNCHSTCYKDCDTCKEYHSLTLPAHIQLARRINTRKTKRIEINERLAYVISYPEYRKMGMACRIEDPEYIQDMNTTYNIGLKIDYISYVKLMVTSYDEALFVAFGIKNYMKQEYEYRILKDKLNASIIDYFYPYSL